LPLLIEIDLVRLASRLSRARAQRISGYDLAAWLHRRGFEPSDRGFLCRRESLIWLRRDEVQVVLDPMRRASARRRAV